MGPKPQTRDEQVYMGRLGRQFTSPIKCSNLRKAQAVEPAGHAAKKRRLAKQLNSLMTKGGPAPPPMQASQPQLNKPSENEPQPDLEFADPVMQVDPDLFSPHPPTKRRTEPDQTANNLYGTWNRLLPQLVDPLLAFIRSTTGKVLGPVPPQLRAVCHGRCEPRTSTVKCLFFDLPTNTTPVDNHYSDFESLDVVACSCHSVAHILLLHGLFPTSPTSPRIAVSVAVLDFYQALFERSCDAVNAMAAALNTFYAQRGYIWLNAKGKHVQDAFRRALGYAIQWYDNLQIQIEERIDTALVHAEHQIQQHTLVADEPNSLAPLPSAPETSPTTSDIAPIQNPTVSPTSSPITPTQNSTVPPPSTRGSAPDEASSATGAPPNPHHSVPHAKDLPRRRTPQSTLDLTPGECARILQQRCPACFGGTHHGRSFNDGGDILVGVNGNFNHRHLRTSGECPKFYDPTYTIPKEQVDAVGDHIERARAKKPKKYTPEVPDESVDDCENSYTTGNGANSKTNMEKFDDSGTMALVCRHDIPLFLANIDTPGEQQKYAIALITHLYSLIPPEATVVILYDVACYDILPLEITSRLLLATAAMHAYGHKWPCQLIYNPRIWKGLGLTDGEGVERLWSRLRKLIGLTRTSARRRQIWLLDRQAAAIAAELRDDLGDWIRRRLIKGVQGQGAAAKSILDDCGVLVEELRQQWEMQRAAQLSVRAPELDAPARLKKELDTVINLQGDLDTVESAIHSARSVISQATPSPESLSTLKHLEETHDDLKNQVEFLYASLNVHDSFPELYGVDLEFVRTLLMARDLKINIRKRAIGSFFEWDKLDQASGGREQSIGTKLHQYT
ncbi:hypothetical protein Hypma_000078 [Hypsizygus marmoreus]|uniref:CxC1-like cysteine cluster associated with KDZ transposases domain-containing protein n=1 Tax=Hypsizygus marmoreus TaxID=39966 RepID=A0A369KAM7_HYPMA|nr:hypothetical protein Hypma_000078 [Hypsizygus marmoreus]